MITFTYEFTDRWATAHISDGQSSLTLYPSMITGGDLGDLAERVLVLLKMDRDGVPAK